MDYHKLKQIDKDRNELVVKSNELIRNTRYELTEQEQKVIIFLISKISKTDTELRTITIRLKEYCEVAGIKKGGSAITHLKKSIQELSDKSWWIPVEENKKLKLFRWIDTAELDGETIEIKLSQSLEPYLLELKKDFTKYELVDVLTLRGKYTIRIYELLQSYRFQKEWIIEIDKLKELINCSKYNAYKEFNRNVIKYAVDEINNHTDLKITYETIKYGKAAKEIKFKINTKDKTDENYKVFMNRNKRVYKYDREK